ncbi:unnamed protein product [[Candida] boidinii]|nr:unnamed protein product [[Candida] boidinii]
MRGETESKQETQEPVSRNQFPQNYDLGSRSAEVNKDQMIEVQKQGPKAGVLENQRELSQAPQNPQPAPPFSKSTSYVHSIQDASSNVPYQAYEVNSTPFTNVPFVYQHVLPNNNVIANDPEFQLNQQQELARRLNVPFMYQNTAISQIQQQQMQQMQQMQIQQGHLQLNGHQLNQQQMSSQHISQQQLNQQQVNQQQQIGPTFGQTQFCSSAAYQPTNFLGI